MPEITSDDIERQFVNNKLDGTLSFHEKGVPQIRGIPMSGFYCPEMDYFTNMTVDFHLIYYNSNGIDQEEFGDGPI